MAAVWRKLCAMWVLLFEVEEERATTNGRRDDGRTEVVSHGSDPAKQIFRAGSIPASPLTEDGQTLP